MKTKAALALSPHSPLIIDEVDLDGPGPGEVLVEIKATGICHTDLTAMNLGLPSIQAEQLPFIPGHEGAGVVVDIGLGVTRVAIGDHVIPLYAPHCGTCSHCMRGKSNYCGVADQTAFGTVMMDGKTRFHYGGQPVYHALFCSTFSLFIFCKKN